MKITVLILLHIFIFSKFLLYLRCEVMPYYFVEILCSGQILLSLYFNSFMMEVPII